MLSLGSLLGDPRIGQRRRRLDRALRNGSYLAQISGESAALLAVFGNSRKG